MPRVRTLVPWAPDLVEAYLRAGRGGDARNALAVLGRRAADAGSTTAAVAHARCRGLVAAAVVTGASNREVAAELFLSPKTIEFHLGQIYRKLGVHSRTQLAAALLDRAGGDRA